MNKRKLVCGDIHGNFKGLVQALQRANYNYKTDHLIPLGDLVDGGTESWEVVDFLATMSKQGGVTLIRGNHDEWFTRFLQTGFHPAGWGQGASKTAISYIQNLDLPERPTNDLLGIQRDILENFPKKHKDFLYSAVNYYIDEENRIYVHGGFDRFIPLEENQEEEFYWNRNLIDQAMSAGTHKLKVVGDYKDIFLGHTTTMFWKGCTTPINAGQIVWNLDTGAGSSGKVTVMNAETKEYWQSDTVKELYGSNFYR